jgi:hypothetical protein
MKERGSVKPRRSAGLALALVGLLALLCAHCKSPTSPKGNGEADITVTNDYGSPLDIYLDGEFKFNLRYRWSIEIDDVTVFHEYALEAREPGTGRLIDSTMVDVQLKDKYSWTVNPPPRVKVTNDWTEKLGEKLAVSMDGVFQFNLERGESRMIMKVEYGERFLEAVNPDTGQEVASTSFKIDGNETYEWDIKKITGE